MNLSAEDIQRLDQMTSTHFEMMYVRVGTEEMTIPDISAIEKAYCSYRKL